MLHLLLHTHTVLCVLCDNSCLLSADYPPKTKNARDAPKIERMTVFFDPDFVIKMQFLGVFFLLEQFTKWAIFLEYLPPHGTQH